MRFRWPLVTAAWNDAMRRARDAEHDEAVRLRGELERVRAQCDARCASAESRAAEAFAASLRVITEARGAISEAVGISKIAAHALFATPVDGEVPNGLSVGEADRARARADREALEQRTRRA